MKSSSISILVKYCLILVLSPLVHSNEFDLYSLSLTELLKVEVSTASGVNETLRDAPAAMIIITAANIRNRGYTSLSDVIYDLPGFDVIGAGQSSQVVAYQRGYRTPSTQRTLFLVNGKVENHLWSHSAYPFNQYSLQNIERIEVLHGPAGALYGPNAFLGVINIITKRAYNVSGSYLKVNLEKGSFNTKAIDISAGGALGQINYNVSFKSHRSDEAGLEDMAHWGFLTEELLSNSTIWGPVLEGKGNSGDYYGKYANPSDEEGITAEIAYKNITLGYTYHRSENGYGSFYAADHAQPNDSWTFLGKQFYLEHEALHENNIVIKTLASVRENATRGRWTEAEPDWNVDLTIISDSFVSSSLWNSFNTAQLFKQDYQYTISDSFSISSGIKYEKKVLNKAYEICFYWADALCSKIDDINSWPSEWGPGIYHSTDEQLTDAPSPRRDALSDNVIETTDRGFYLQGKLNIGKFIINAGARYDNNSVYGSTSIPRVTAIWQPSGTTTVKLLYGEAFQEPSPKQLYGGWNGRKANPDLKPEKMKSVELIYMYQNELALHSVSIFRSNFDNVIKEEAENAGSRVVHGLEYRGNASFSNIFEKSRDIEAYLYYTYTETDSSIHYDHTLSNWVKGSDEIGDIAPHKLNIGFNIPFDSNWNVNFHANYISSRRLYSRNPLSDQSRADGGRDAKAYSTIDVTVIYDFGRTEISLKVKNLYDKSYLHPGNDSASSGDDFTRRALGYGNSMVPQVGRNWMISLKKEF